MDAPVNYGATNNNINGKPTLEEDTNPTDLPHPSSPPTTTSPADVRLAVLQTPLDTNGLSGVAHEGEEDEDEERAQKEENRLDTLCVVGFCLGLIGFLSTFHLKRGVFRRPPYPLVGNIQDIDPSMMPMEIWEDGVNLVPVVWGLRYIRKIALTLFQHRCLNFVEAVAVPEVRGGTSGGCCSGPARASWWPWYVVPVVLYHGGLSSWVGLATNYHLPYHVSDIEWVVGGLAVFLAGELITVIRTLISRRARRKGRRAGDAGCCGGCGVQNGRAVATSRTVEAGEVLSCVGFALFTLTLPACVMAIVRLTIAVPVCMKKLHGKAF